MIAKLNSWVGEPYEHMGCLKFVKRALAELGVEIEGTDEAVLRDARKVKKIDHPCFGAVAVFENPPEVEGHFHVALMMDSRWAIQSGPLTNGVGRIEITRHPWSHQLRGFYLPKELECS